MNRFEEDMQKKENDAFKNEEKNTGSRICQLRVKTEKQHKKIFHYVQRIKKITPML